MKLNFQQIYRPPRGIADIFPHPNLHPFPPSGLIRLLSFPAIKSSLPIRGIREKSDACVRLLKQSRDLRAEFAAGQSLIEPVVILSITYFSVLLF